VTIKEELHLLVDQLPEGDAAEVLDYVRWLAAASETLSDAELVQVREGEAQIARGEYVTLADLAHSLRE